MEKFYILDTNVLLHDPMAIHAFAEHHVVIPMTVLEELDIIKDRKDKEVSREARIAINNIEKIVGSATPKEIQNGVPITTQDTQRSVGSLSIYVDQRIKNDDNIPYLSINTQHANDNRIINVALNLQMENAGSTVCLVTKDINMRLKAKGSGLHIVEDYRNDRVIDDLELLAQGYETIDMPFWDFVGGADSGNNNVSTANLGGDTVHCIDRNIFPHAYPTQFILDNKDFIGLITKMDDKHIHLLDLNKQHLMSQNYWGVRPRNIEQAMSFFLLNYDDADMTVLTGPAGSGKTLLALAYGLHAIIEEKRFNKLIVARSTTPMAEDIGFLPGTEEEKMAPWLAAFDDNLEVLHGNDEHSMSSIDYVKEKANIQFKSLNFMRGRSFNNAYIIIDESQGLTQFQLKSIITRVGMNSKIVVLGNLAQIDNKYITPLTSGLTYLVEKSKNYQHAGIMHINGIERSRLAEFAEENL
ncbi:putative ATPase [gamma proteobacterium IMCC1989]|nr:putative ATPase [gamma proteobacterium IMCC1989]